MSSYNKVILMGNLTRDPELRYTQSNMPICKIGLAVNRRFKDGQSGEWREEATFVDVTIFGKRGEAFAKYHQKGKPAFIEGELRLDNWEDQQGQKRSKLYVVGNEWQFVGGGQGGGGGGHSGGGGGGHQDAQPAQAPAQSGGGYGGYGNSGGGQGGGGQSGGGQPAGGQGQSSGGYLEVEDTPF